MLKMILVSTTIALPVLFLSPPPDLHKILMTLSHDRAAAVLAGYQEPGFEARPPR